MPSKRQGKNMSKSNNPEKNCATCMHSQFKHNNVHQCGMKGHAVTGDYFCNQWHVLIIDIGNGFPPQKFGAMHACPRHSN